MLADVAGPDRAEQGVDDRVDRDVGVAVAGEPVRVLDPHAAGVDWLSEFLMVIGLGCFCSPEEPPAATELMMAILWDRMPYLSAMVNARVIALDDAPSAYATFNEGSADKFIIDPHGMLAS